MAGIGSYTDGAGVPRCTRGVRLVDANGAPHDFLISDDGEVFTTDTEREYNVRVSISGTQNTSTTAYYGLIDLSDNVNWPHDGTEHIDISEFLVFIDKAEAARGSLTVGVITRVNGTNADVSWVAAHTFLENASVGSQVIANYSPSQLKCRVSGGALTHIKTNSVSTNLAAINTATPIAFGPGGPTFAPGVGDIIVRIVTTTGGNVNWALGAFYPGHPQAGA